MRSLFARILLWFLVTVLLTAGGMMVTTAVIIDPQRERTGPFELALTQQVRDAQTAWETGGGEALRRVLHRHRRFADRNANPAWRERMRDRRPGIGPSTVVPGSGPQNTDQDPNSPNLAEAPPPPPPGDNQPPAPAPGFPGGPLARAFFTDAAGKDLLTGDDRSPQLAEARTRSMPWPFRNRMVLARQSADGKYWYILTVERRNWFLYFVRVEHLWVLGLALLLCYGLAYSLSRPVRDLQTAVDRFGRGDLTARVKTTRGDELGQLAGTFNQMAERMETLLTAERRLLLDISHELRSPLARLAVAIELARAGNGDESALNRIQKEADRLNDLVGELLQVTRVEGDPSQRKMELVQLDELLTEITVDCEIEATARGCSLLLDTPSKIAVHGDAELLRRAVENVVRNAIRYSPKGQRVEVSTRNGGGRAIIAIRDHGPGVPPESLPHIFEPFYRVEPDRSRQNGGVGLGLAIARRAIDLHSGKVTARNMTPGLLVEIELPV